MTAAPLLSTDRLDLWQPRAADLDGLVALIDDPAMTRFLGPARATAHSQFDRLLRNAGSWSLYGYGVFMVRPRGAAELIGSCGIFHTRRGFPAEQGMEDVPEAGWIVRRDWWGQGIAQEAMMAACHWFDAAHGPRRVVCMIERGNAASVAVATRLGFRPYGRQDSEDGAKLVLYERDVADA